VVIELIGLQGNKYDQGAVEGKDKCPPGVAGTASDGQGGGGKNEVHNSGDRKDWWMEGKEPGGGGGGGGGGVEKKV